MGFIGKILGRAASFRLQAILYFENRKSKIFNLHLKIVDVQCEKQEGLRASGNPVSI
jgi:hypothetical protein